MDNWLLLAGLGAAALALPVIFYMGRLMERRAAHRAKATAQDIADRLLADARRDAESFRASLITSGKDELTKAREVWEAEVVRRREEISRSERRMEERDRQLERKVELTERRERELESKLSSVAALEQRVAGQEQELRNLVAEGHKRLEAVAGLSAAEAKRELLRSVEDEAKADAANLVRTLKEQARRDADKEAKKIVAIAIQRIAAEQASESTIASVTLPNDEMKGRIIGRAQARDGLELAMTLGDEVTKLGLLPGDLLLQRGDRRELRFELALAPLGHLDLPVQLLVPLLQAPLAARDLLAPAHDFGLPDLAGLGELFLA